MLLLSKKEEIDFLIFVFIENKIYLCTSISRNNYIWLYNI